MDREAIGLAHVGLDKEKVLFPLTASAMAPLDLDGPGVNTCTQWWLTPSESLLPKHRPLKGRIWGYELRSRLIPEKNAAKKRAQMARRLALGGPLLSSTVAIF